MRSYSISVLLLAPRLLFSPLDAFWWEMLKLCVLSFRYAQSQLPENLILFHCNKAMFCSGMWNTKLYNNSYNCYNCMLLVSLQLVLIHIHTHCSSCYTTRALYSSFVIFNNFHRRISRTTSKNDAKTCRHSSILKDLANMLDGFPINALLHCFSCFVSKFFLSVKQQVDVKFPQNQNCLTPWPPNAFYTPQKVHYTLQEHLDARPANLGSYTIPPNAWFKKG